MNKTISSTVPAVPVGTRFSNDSTTGIRTIRFRDIRNTNSSSEKPIEKSLMNNVDVQKKNTQMRSSVSNILSRLTAPTASSQAKMRVPLKPKDPPKPKDLRKFQFSSGRTKPRDIRISSSPSTLQSPRSASKAQVSDPQNLQISKPLPVKFVPGSWNYDNSGGALNVGRKAPLPPSQRPNQSSNKGRVPTSLILKEMTSKTDNQHQTTRSASCPTRSHDNDSSSSPSAVVIKNSQAQTLSDNTYPSPRSVSSLDSTAPSLVDAKGVYRTSHKAKSPEIVELAKPTPTLKSKQSAPSLTVSKNSQSQSVAREMSGRRDPNTSINVESPPGSSSARVSESHSSLNETLRIRNKQLKTQLNEVLASSDQLAADLAVNQASRNTLRYQVDGHELLHEEMVRKYQKSQRQLRQRMRQCTLLVENIHNLKLLLEESHLENLILRRKLNHNEVF